MQKIVAKKSVQKWGFINDKRVRNVYNTFSKNFGNLYTKIIVKWGREGGGGGVENA